MAHFRGRNGAFRNARKYLSNINYWYSIHYKILSYFAYLRPKTTRLANTRLFFGVEWETQSKKSKNGYKLKVAHKGPSQTGKWMPHVFRSLACRRDQHLCRRRCLLLIFNRQCVITAGERKCRVGDNYNIECMFAVWGPLRGPFKQNAKAMMRYGKRGFLLKPLPKWPLPRSFSWH